MKSRPSDLCVLVASRSRVARADFARGEVTSFEYDGNPSVEGLVALVELAASLGPALPKNVWILADEVFTHEVRLRSQAVEGLSREQLLRLLAYEASGISGTAASESSLAYLPSSSLPLERAFTVVQIARTDHEAIESTLASRGAKLAGLAHPAAVPRALDENAKNDWRRVEAWPDLLVDVECKVGRVVSRLRRTDPTRRARDLPGDAPITETLETGGGLALAAPAVARAFDLAHENDLRAWIAAWGRVLHDDPTRIAAVRAVPRALSPRRRALYSVAGVLLAAGACAWHYTQRVAVRDDLIVEVAAAKAPAERLAKTRAESATLKAEVQKLETEVATMRAALARAGWSADAPARLLDAAATGRPAGLTVDALEVGWSGVRVRGVALRAELVDELGRALSTALQPEGFVVAPADRKRRELDSGIEIYEYTLEVRPRVGAPALVEAER